MYNQTAEVLFVKDNPGEEKKRNCLFDAVQSTVRQQMLLRPEASMERTKERLQKRYAAEHI
jgi:hypothetical protein